MSIETENKLTEEQEAAEDYRAMLSDNVLKVTFTKTDGSERVLIGTTNYGIIQEAMGDDTSWIPLGVKELGDIVPSTKVVVFDLEILEWRGFNSTRVISITDQI